MLLPMGFGVKIYKFLSGKMELQFRTSLGAYFTALVLEYRQGGIGGSGFTYPLALSRVLTVAFSLNSGVWSYNWYTQDSKVNISNTAVSNPKGFPYNWLVIGIA